MTLTSNTYPVFSIITPTFRRPEMLSRNIRSVIAQTYGNYEHIIVDDGNGPETDKIVSSFNDERLILVKHDQSRGASAAYNTGIKKSRGEFITFLDDDDEYLPEFLKKMYKQFCAYSEIHFIWTGIERVTDTKSGEKAVSRIVWPSNFRTKEEALTAASAIGNGFGLCVRRESISTLGLYDENLELACDTDFLIRLASKFSCVTIPEVLVRVYRHSTGQLTGSAGNMKRIAIREVLFERYNKEFQSNPEMYVIHLISYALLCYTSGAHDKGRDALVRLIKIRPFRIRTYVDMISLELNSKGVSETRMGKLLKRLAS